MISGVNLYPESETIVIGIPPTAENLRAEIARHKLTRQAICTINGMNLNQLSNYLNSDRLIPLWAGHNIGFAVNVATGLRIFGIEMGRGLMIPREQGVRSPYGRRPSIVLPTRKPRRRRKKRASQAS